MSESIKEYESFKKHKRNVCLKEAKGVDVNLKRPLVLYSGDSGSDEIDNTDESFKCPNCPKTYNSSRGLRKHKNDYHSKPNPYFEKEGKLYRNEHIDYLT